MIMIGPRPWHAPEPGAPAVTARSLLAERDEMTNKTMPEEPASPLITAVEIENFKGIGRPVRIELRPITLLFGRNSAGKSTVLHALCYAHELLSHGNVDAGMTDLGGDQIDLGGFRNFVHAHDRDRTVRLRFECNLETWEVPEPLVEKMARHEGLEPGSDDDFAVWVHSQVTAESVRSGWVELAVQWNNPWPGDRPVLASYEVGVNEALFGRVARVGDSDTDFNLEFDWMHPLFDSLRPVRSPAGDGDEAAVQVCDAPEPGTDAWRLHRAGVRGATPLPDWDRPLALRDDHPDDNDLDDEAIPRFEALVSGFLVGLGRTLRDELAALRYVGPVRKLRPRTNAAPGSRDRESWSDGSAAWNLLVRRDPDPRSRDDLLDAVNEWLERGDRLDTGYKLRRKSTVELPKEASGVWKICLLAQLPAKYRNEYGEVDLDHWARKEAAEIADLRGCDPDDVEDRIKNRRRDEKEPAAMDHSGQDQSDVEKWIESDHEIYRLISSFVTAVDRIEKGGPEVKDLVRAIAAAPLRPTLQLVTAGSKMPVRTSDVGVGISQLLPVVVAALDDDRPGITAIEQPELHLHPAMQVELGDLFAKSVNLGRVFLIENHSEHLMLRLLRRIEETHGDELPEGKPPLRPRQVSVVFIEQVDGEVRATPLRIDETGEFIDRWPSGFFRERAAELF